MENEDISIQAHLYEDSCHNPSIQRHFTDGALWMKKEIVHAPDNEEGITAEELKHQLYGANVQRKIDTDIICDLMITMLNDGMIETRDIGAVNMRIRKAMEE